MYNSLLLLLLLFQDVLPKESAKVLLISFDGFRHDYLSKTETPNFDQLINSGSKAKWLTDAFISKTFPNHFTIVTGLYEESHGIVSNGFYDPKLGESFCMNDTDSKWWSVGAEPIWVTNQKQCKTCKTAVFFWPGGTSVIKGVRPSYFKPNYTNNVPIKERMDQVVKWFSEDDSVNLALLYYHEPDHTAHSCGPNSSNVTEQIKYIDQHMGYLIQKLKKAKLFEKVNMIVTSDHGFTELKPAPSVIDLNLHLPSRLYDADVGSPIVGLWPKDRGNQSSIDLIYNTLKDVKANMTVYRKSEIPLSFHYSNSDRIAPVVVVADLGFSVVVGKDSAQYYQKSRRGDHGYDNREMDMHPFFVAHGPAFRKEFISEPFNNVDIYPMICHILGLKPAPNNGSLANVCPMLVGSCWNSFANLVSGESGSFANLGLWFLAVVGMGACAFIALVYVVWTVCQKYTRRHAYRGQGMMLQPLPQADITWDDEEEGEEVAEKMFVVGQQPGVSRNWKSWSAMWKRKWRHLRRSRTIQNDENDSLMTVGENDVRNVTFDSRLPSHLAALMK